LFCISFETDIRPEETIPVTIPKRCERTGIDTTPGIPGSPDVARWGETTVLTQVHIKSEPVLAKIAEALNILGRLAGSLQRGQQDADQKRDDPNHNQQFNERKSGITPSMRT